WDEDYRPVVEQAATIQVTEEQVHWWDWERTSGRPERPQTMKLGGLLGSAVLHDVGPAVRTVLLAGSVVHVGKACVFGHGGYGVQRAD
ncbi:MAG: CRISPR system precrRNA processing endoribonuclease RAMP protein Cas6, partial [Chloroflexaceae bacterium]|nr:CRISPR system precrRNA processing endoribonuclease RAMP protein Cas6 [Chloroflexaceae bacterium]